MAFIKVLKDSNDNTIYPQSLTSAVIDSNGNSLDTIHQQFVMATAIEEDIEDIVLGYENTANKVTEISAESTDVQYPSALATYKAILANKSVGVKIEIAETTDAVTNPNDTTIYLIGTVAPYEEYLYVNESWELIGNTSVDLTGYITEEQLAEKNYVTTEALEAKGYATVTYVDDQIGDIETVLAALTTVE